MYMYVKLLLYMNFVATRYQVMTVAADLIVEAVTEPVRFIRYAHSELTTFTYITLRLDDLYLIILWVWASMLVTLPAVSTVLYWLFLAGR